MSGHRQTARPPPPTRPPPPPSTNFSVPPPPAMTPSRPPPPPGYPPLSYTYPPQHYPQYVTYHPPPPPGGGYYSLTPHPPPPTVVVASYPPPMTAPPPSSVAYSAPPPRLPPPPAQPPPPSLAPPPPSPRQAVHHHPPSDKSISHVASEDAHKKDVDKFISDLARKDLRSSWHSNNKKRSRSRSPPPPAHPGSERDDHHRRRRSSRERHSSGAATGGGAGGNERKGVEERRASRHSLSPARRPSRRSFDRETDEEKEKRVRAHLKLTPKQLIEQEKQIWTRSAPADLYYQRDPAAPLILRATPKLEKLLHKFQTQLIDRGRLARAKHPSYKPFKLPRHEVIKCRVGRGCCGGHKDDDVSSCSSSSSDSDNDSDEKSQKDSSSSSKGANNKANQSSSSSSKAAKKKNKKKAEQKNETLEFMKNRQKQSYRLHEELWDNQPGELNDGPACRCSLKARKFGIRHGIYQGEDQRQEVVLDPLTNNGTRLRHYRVTISPPTNFLVKHPTRIAHDGHDFTFEGFSLFTCEPLPPNLPTCHILRFSIKYSVLYFEEKMPDNVTLKELELFDDYFFKELLELHDFDITRGSKSQFYFMPRFVRDLAENGKEILSMNNVMSYLLEAGTTPLVDEMELMQVTQMPRLEWENEFVDKVRGTLVQAPGMKPPTIRVDQLDREQDDEKVIKYPEVVHFGTCPPQMCYAGNTEYMRAWRDCVKFRHLMANMPKPTMEDRRKLRSMEDNLNNLKANIKQKRDVAVAVSAQGFYRTGLMTDIVQHGLLLPVLVGHLRFHGSLDHFEKEIGVKFKNRHLLQLAMTHPSYKDNHGTNPDHARNALSHCGIRQIELGDKRVHTAENRKRGINMLISIMSKFGKDKETESKVGHNERLEFLGDAVVEFITSVHLYHIFPDLEEGGLATYRAALVQNQHLAVLAEKLGLEKYMLYAHGNDLCHDAELRHAMANCFEAVMGAIFLDQGIDAADRILTNALFGGPSDDSDLHQVWEKFSKHPLQLQEPDGDRHWIKSYPLLQKLVTFEEEVGLEFTHIRLLARAFSDRSLSNCNLTMGSNQRLEFLGDTVLQLVTSDYLYKHFPDHHEGHLSLLRSSLVNNRTQATVCEDLGIPQYAMYSNPRKDLKMKDRADLLEAFIGALYIDKDLDYCMVFAQVCFFPRLYQFITNQEWNDPKSKLQQCCLTLRTMERGEPDIPVYKMINSKGPTNSRIYTVAVYFRGERLAKAEGPSIQQAEMNAATIALTECGHLFPHLQHQRRILEKSIMHQDYDTKRAVWEGEVRAKRRELGLDNVNAENSKRNDEIIKRNLEKQLERKMRILDQSKKESREETTTTNHQQKHLDSSRVRRVAAPPPSRHYHRSPSPKRVRTTSSFSSSSDTKSNFLPTNHHSTNLSVRSSSSSSSSASQSKKLSTQKSIGHKVPANRVNQSCVSKVSSPPSSKTSHDDDDEDDDDDEEEGEISSDDDNGGNGHPIKLVDYESISSEDDN